MFCQWFNTSDVFVLIVTEYIPLFSSSSVCCLGCSSSPSDVIRLLFYVFALCLSSFCVCPCSVCVLALCVSLICVCPRSVCVLALCSVFVLALCLSCCTCTLWPINNVHIAHEEQRQQCDHQVMALSILRWN